MIDKKDVLASFRQELVKPLSAHTPPPVGSDAYNGLDCRISLAESHQAG